MKTKLVSLFVTACTISVLGVYPMARIASSDNVTAQVIGKEVKNSKESSKYLVFTEGETFEVTDSIIRMKFNSSDLYGAIPVGTDCVFEVDGWRVPVLSMYRNINGKDCE